MTGLARFAYSAVLWLTQPLYLARLWRRGRAEPGYRQALGERFGRYRGAAPAPGALWLHAVSLGETRAAAGLVDALRAQRPGLRLLLTHGTATGRAAGAALLAPGDRQAWLPWDTPGATRRFMRHFRPAVGVLMETELWPNLLHAAARAGVPVVLANARLSEQSARRGQRLAALLRPAVAGLAGVLAQTEDDARRLRAGGARHVSVCGNLKFDMTPDAAQLAQGARWRAAVPRPIVLAASTREGEEALLLAAWAALPAPRPLLLLVPRHPQRFDEAAALVRAAGLTLMRRSGWADDPPAGAAPADVWLGDSLGEMALYCAAAPVALLGGSFLPLGGQNLIEAAACGCVVVMGPHTFNFAEAAALAEAAGAAIRVADVQAGVAQALALPGTPRCAEASRHALDFAARHRGAAERMARDIIGMFNQAQRCFTPQEKDMAKGYWIAHVDVADAEGYKAYIAANARPFKAHGARFLVRAGRYENPEGSSRTRHVVIEFPTYQAALDCWNSADYQAAVKLRLPVATVDIVIVEGYDGAQPSDS